MAEHLRSDGLGVAEAKPLPTARALRRPDALSKAGHGGWLRGGPGPPPGTPLPGVRANRIHRCLMHIFHSSFVFKPP